MAPDRHRQDIREVADAAGVPAWQDRSLGRTPAQRDQRPALRLRLRAPGLRPGPDPGAQMAQLFNACESLLDRRLAAGDGDRLALTGPAGAFSYASLWDRVCRTAAGLRAVGAGPEQRILMVMADSPDFAVVYLAALRVGAIPVPVSTMLRPAGIAELLRDSRARFLAVTSEVAAAAGAAG